MPASARKLDDGRARAERGRERGDDGQAVGVDRLERAPHIATGRLQPISLITSARRAPSAT